jgi:hypothetical protein
MRVSPAILCVSAIVLVPNHVLAQATTGSQTAENPAQAAPLPPATKLEAFTPAAGSVTTLGFDEIGRLGSGFGMPAGVEVDARELRSGDQFVRGMIVRVQAGQQRIERAFVDVDELPDLIRGIEALIELKANPTGFKNFEVRYQTKGDLVLVAFNNARGEIQYAIEAGRVLKANRYLNANEMQKIRDMFNLAAQRLAQK